MTRFLAGVAAFLAAVALVLTLWPSGRGGPSAVRIAGALA